MEAKNELKQFDLREIEALKVRTKALYAEAGEKSTRYFYSLEKRRQAEQSIKILTKDNNETCTLQQDIIKEVHSYYKSLYTAELTDPTAQEQILNIDTSILIATSRDSVTSHRGHIFINVSYSDLLCQIKYFFNQDEQYFSW